MRTTLNLEEDVLRAVRSLSRESGRSLGAVVSDLVRRALRPAAGPAYEAGFPVFEVREGTPPMTPDMVRAGLEDD